MRGISVTEKTLGLTDQTLESIDEQELDIETILPYGGMILSVVAGSQLSKTDLKRMLAQRGIFLTSSEKEHTVPLLMSLLFTPREFEFLRERQRTKEDLPKSITRTIQCENENFSLLEVITDRRLPETILPKYASYKILETPSFMPKENGNVLLMEYKIQRRNRTKDWAHNKSTHTGTIRFEKVGKDIQVTMDYTSPETKDLSDKITKHVETQLKDKGIVNRERKVKQITFGDFNNEERIAFLLSLTAGTGLLQFKQITDIDIGPDQNEQLPKSIEWIRRVKSMMLRGEHLHLMEFLTDVTYHRSLIIEMIEADFEFTYNGSSGICTVEYGFTGCLHSKNPSIEFEAKVKKFSFNTGQEPQSKINTQRFLQNTFNKLKAEKYTKFEGKD